jgi:50S ribosomal subunit-associated GTPase HflX
MRPVTVAMAGYTNAGKSHLARALTKDLVAFEPEDALFATLGSTQRRLVLPSGASCRLIDTVGFVEGLPHSLVASFRSTLGDVAEADVLLHVRDPTHPRCQEHARVVDETVRAVVADAGRSAEAQKPFGGKSVIEVWTKLDLLTQAADEAVQAGPAPGGSASGGDGTLEWEVVEQAALHAGEISIEELSLLLERTIKAPQPAEDSETMLRSAAPPGRASETAGPQTILTSAVTGDGLDDVLHAIDRHVLVQRGLRRLAVVLDGGAESDSLAQAWLFSAHGGVSVTDAQSVCQANRADDESEDAVLIRALVTPAALAKFTHMFPAQASRASLS